MDGNKPNIHQRNFRVYKREAREEALKARASVKKTGTSDMRTRLEKKTKKKADGYAVLNAISKTSRGSNKSIFVRIMSRPGNHHRSPLTGNKPFFFFSASHRSIQTFIWSRLFWDPTFTVGMIRPIRKAQQNMVSSRNELCSL